MPKVATNIAAWIRFSHILTNVFYLKSFCSIALLVCEFSIIHHVARIIPEYVQNTVFLIYSGLQKLISYFSKQD